MAWECLVPGCLTTYYDSDAGRRDHLPREHVRCECGWVGLYIKKHIAARRAWGYDVSGCQMVERFHYKPPRPRPLIEVLAEDADPRPRVWL